MTGTNASLVTELAQEKLKVNELSSKVQELEQYTTSTNLEQIDDSIKANIQQIVKRDLFPMKKLCRPHELLQSATNN